MTKKTRTILFSICLFLFILIAPLVVFYAQGYRFDFETKRIVQTGAFYFKVLPADVKIYINNELKRRTSFFFNSALIEGLLPKKHKVTIRRDGYSTWTKALEIKEKKVVKARNVILFPENPDFTILSERVKNFWFSPNQKKIILKKNQNDKWTLKLYETERNIKSHLIYEKDISPDSVDLLKIEFSNDSREIFLSTIIGEIEQEKKFVLKLDEQPPIPRIKKIIQGPENIIASTIFNRNNYQLDSFGQLFRNNEKLNKELFTIKPEIDYELNIFEEWIFIRKNRTLYIFNQETKAFERFFNNLYFLEISPDFKKLAHLSRHEIWILFLEEETSPPRRKAGEKLFLIRFSGKIRDFFWLNSNHLILNIEDKIKIIEIDNRDRINIVKVAEFERAEIFWNEIKKRLYILSENKLLRSEALLP